METAVDDVPPAAVEPAEYETSIPRETLTRALLSAASVAKSAFPVLAVSVVVAEREWTRSLPAFSSPKYPLEEPEPSVARPGR